MMSSLSSRGSRAERVAVQLREELSKMMLLEMKDPRVRLAGVSSVKLAPDMRSAHIKVSAFGEESERDKVVKAMRHAEPYLRAELRKRMENLKYAPKMKFELDRSIEYSVNINATLQKISQGIDTESTSPKP